MLSPNELCALFRQADQAARRLSRRAALSPPDHEDIRQDLLLDLLRRLRLFRPERGTLHAFAASCFAHRVSRLRQIIRQDRAQQHPTSLDAPLPGSDGLTLADTLSNADGYGAWVGQPTDPIAITERRLDLERALASLPDAALPLCAALTRQTPHELIEAGHCPRTSLYRQINAIRLGLLANGIAPSWNGTAAAWVEA